MAALSLGLRPDDARVIEWVQRSLARNYLDECYASLGIQLIPLHQFSKEHDLVQSYIFNSCCCLQGHGANVKHLDDDAGVVQVFRIENSRDSMRFEPYRRTQNRRVLWHGSRMMNWLSILRKGLLICPPGVPHNGSSFGAGIYFTDKISKAMSYSHAMVGDSRQVFLLSEVALGDCRPAARSGQPTKSKSPHVSCHGVGRCVPDPAGDFEDAFGAVWPLGKPTPVKDKSATLPHSEFVVYNSAHARMRYIVVTDGLLSR
ncbi:hypothetical protein PINS_up005482 [Pythium insidiosum]|nr:hypothetical protein PINS_up005482 [Pythium insidiosum]